MIVWQTLVENALLNMYSDSFLIHFTPNYTLYIYKFEKNSYVMKLIFAIWRSFSEESRKKINEVCKGRRNRIKPSSEQWNALSSSDVSFYTCVFTCMASHICTSLFHYCSGIKVLAEDTEAWEGLSIVNCWQTRDDYMIQIAVAA